MKKSSYALFAIISFWHSHICAQVSIPTDIHIGSAKVAVHAIITGDEHIGLNTDSILEQIDIYAATLPIFAKSGQDKLTYMERTGNIFHAEVPTETTENIGSVRVYNDGQFIGGTPVLMSQEFPTSLTIFFSSEGNILGANYSYMDLDKWMNVSSISQSALSCNPFIFIPKNLSLYESGWGDVTYYKTQRIWPEFRDNILKNYSVPEEASDWLLNNLKIRFATQCILPYTLGAKTLAKLTVEEPPMAAYSFLDSINYEPGVLLKYTTMMPLRDLFNAILRYPEGGFVAIGDTPISHWQQEIDMKLAQAMQSRPQLLLDLLAAMSYIHQIEVGNPLTETQISNIQAGLTDDIGQIVLTLNAKSQNNVNDATEPQNLVNTNFNLNDYIDSTLPGRPIVIDLWNTWCVPCKSAISQCEDIQYGYRNSNVAFVYICDESSPEAQWEQEAQQIGHIQLRINREDMSKLLEQHNLIGFPSYIFFDSDHNTSSTFTSFPGLRIYRRRLEALL